MTLASLTFAGVLAAQAPQAPPASTGRAPGLARMGLRRSASPARGDPAGRTGNRTRRGAAPAAPRQPDTSPKHVPGSTQEFTLAHIRDYWDVGDWFPDDHPPMPNVVVHGRQPHVRGCAMCHMPNGKGRPENAPVAGQPDAYIVQQLHDFKNGLRASAEPRKANTAQMIEAAQGHDRRGDRGRGRVLLVDEVDAVDHAWARPTTVPKTRISGNVFFPLPGGGPNRSATASSNRPKTPSASSCAIRARASSPTCRPAA